MSRAGRHRGGSRRAPAAYLCREPSMTAQIPNIHSWTTSVDFLLVNALSHCNSLASRPVTLPSHSKVYIRTLASIGIKSHLKFEVPLCNDGQVLHAPVLHAPSHVRHVDEFTLVAIPGLAPVQILRHPCTLSKGA